MLKIRPRTQSVKHRGLSPFLYPTTTRRLSRFPFLKATSWRISKSSPVAKRTKLGTQLVRANLFSLLKRYAIKDSHQEELVIEVGSVLKRHDALLGRLGILLQAGEARQRSGHAGTRQ